MLVAHNVNRAVAQRDTQGMTLYLATGALCWNTHPFHVRTDKNQTLAVPQAKSRVDAINRGNAVHVIVLQHPFFNFNAIVSSAPKRPNEALPTYLLVFQRRGLLLQQLDDQIRGILFLGELFLQRNEIRSRRSTGRMAFRFDSIPRHAWQGTCCARPF